MKHLLLSFLLIATFQLKASSDFDPDSFPMDFDDDSFLSYPESSFNPGELDCPQGNDPLAPLYEIKCKLKDPHNPGPKACDCIRDKAMDNILIQAQQTSAENDVTKELDKRRGLYVQRFKDVFRRMTVEAEVQKKILGIEDKSPYVGCDPESNATSVLKYAENHYKLKHDTLLKFKAELERQYRNRCDSEGKRRHFLVRKDKCNELQQSMDEIDRQVGVNKKKEQNVVEKCTAGLQPQSSVAKPWIINPMGQGSCSIGSNTGSDLGIGLAPEDHTAGGVKIKSMISDQCKFHKAPSLCQGFLDTKKDLEKQVQDRYQHDVNTQCISFAEYQLFKSAPSEGLMAEFAKKEKKHKDLLLTPEDSQGLNGERLKFLRNNPVIFKLARDSGNRKVLSESLHGMAKNWGKMTQPQKLKAYLDFMGNRKKEGVVSSLSKKDAGKTEMTMCDDMARNYTTIMVADYLSSPTKMQAGQDRLNDLQTALRSCMEIKHKKNAVDDADKALKTDPIFTLAPEDVKEDQRNVENEYKAFLAQHCGAKPGQLAYADHMKQKCQGKDPETCRQEYLDGSNWKSENDQLQDSGVKPSLTEEEFDEVKSHTDSDKQDNEFKAWWYENVGSKRSPYPTAMKGGLGAFNAARENDAKISSEAEVPPQFQTQSVGSSTSGSNGGSVGGAGGGTGGSTGGGSQNDSKSDTKLAEKQVVPEFSPTPAPTFNKDVFRKGSTVYEAMPELKGKSPAEQVEMLEDFKQSLPAEDKNLVPAIEDAQDAIANGEEPVRDEKKEKEENNKIVDKAPVVGSGGGNKQALSNNLPLPSQVGAGGFNGGASKVQLKNEVKKDKITTQVNNTLLTANENRTNENGGGNTGRGPASAEQLITVSASTPAIVVTSNAKADELPRTPEGVLIVRNDNLNIDPQKYQVDEQGQPISDPFSYVTTDKKRLGDFIRSSLDKEVVGTEVVRVQVDKNGPHALYLVKPSKNGLIIKRVDRVATYKGLIYAQQAAVQTP